MGKLFVVTAVGAGAGERKARLGGCHYPGKERIFENLDAFSFERVFESAGSDLDCLAGGLDVAFGVDYCDAFFDPA